MLAGFLPWVWGTIWGTNEPTIKFIGYATKTTHPNMKPYWTPCVPIDPNFGRPCTAYELSPHLCLKEWRYTSLGWFPYREGRFIHFLRRPWFDQWDLVIHHIKAYVVIRRTMKKYVKGRIEEWTTPPYGRLYLKAQMEFNRVK